MSHSATVPIGLFQGTFINTAGDVPLFAPLEETKRGNFRITADAINTGIPRAQGHYSEHAVEPVVPSSRRRPGKNL